MYNYNDIGDDIMECPQCGYKFLGKIGRRKYFCSNCYSEIFISNNKYKVMSLNEKGIPTVVKTSAAEK